MAPQQFNPIQTLGNQKYAAVGTEKKQ